MTMVRKILSNAAKKGKMARGFTLVELLVVVAVIGLLALIAIPTFLSQRGKAQNSSAESSVRNSLSTLVTLKDDLTGTWSNYATVDCLVSNVDAPCSDATKPQGLKQAEGSYTFQNVTSVSTGPKIIAVDKVSDTEVVLSAKSDSGTFYALDVNATTATKYGKTTTATAVAIKTAAQANAGWQ